MFLFIPFCTLYIILGLHCLGTYALYYKTIEFGAMSPEMIEDFMRLDLCPYCNDSHAVIFRTLAVEHLTEPLIYYAETRLGNCVCFFISDLRTTD